MDKQGTHASGEARNPTGTSPAADVERWEIDPARSSLKFVLRHLVVQEIHGGFGRWGGTLFLDRKQPQLSSMQVWIELATISTGSPERDDHIRSNEFLEVERYPRAEFESSSIEARAGRALVHGRLQLHGITRDLDVEVDPYTPPSADSLYRVRGKLDRQAFGLHWNQDLDVGGIVLGDEIKLVAEVRLVRMNGETKGH
jgi:polyisoprenoid-binding protein YceI